MKLWKYFKMGKFIIEKIRSDSNGEHCGNCYFNYGRCEIYGGIILVDLRKEDCIKEIG